MCVWVCVCADRANCKQQNILQHAARIQTHKNRFPLHNRVVFRMKWSSSSASTWMHAANITLYTWMCAGVFGSPLLYRPTPFANAHDCTIHQNRRRRGRRPFALRNSPNLSLAHPRLMLRSRIRHSAVRLHVLQCVVPPLIFVVATVFRISCGCISYSSLWLGSRTEERTHTHILNAEKANRWRTLRCDGNDSNKGTR